jgi:DNA-directed RNA polymerase specialized sigma24 family protein
MHDAELYDALASLRAAPCLDAPELQPSWYVVVQALKQMGSSVGSGLASDRDDAVVEAWIKVRRSIHGLQADDPVAARAWLKQIYRRTYLDNLRRRRNRREVFDDGGPSHNGSGDGLIARLEAPDPAVDPAKRDPAELAPYENALFDRVDDHLATLVRPMARANARRHAELAYESIVRRRPTQELLAALGGDVKPDTFYQWVRRGRELVLLPVLRRWLAEDEIDEGERNFAETLVDILQSRQRADAGRSRGGGGEGDS